jgi:glycosyltransferase involved in cell wall biosynthesis
MRLSVSMIVRLEESCLATCLESVKGADELVVVDTRLPTDPPDRTREIAESFGAVLYDFPWVDDFAAARNESLSKCTGEAGV